MANRVDLTPFPAMFQLATQAGAGERQRYLDQMAMQQQQMANQQAAQQASIAAAQQSQMFNAQQQAGQQARGQQFQAAMQQGQWDQQNAYQAQGAENQLAVANQYGANQRYAQAFDDIRNMELKGFQYTPTQEMERRKLEDSFDKLMHDPAVSPQQRQQVQNQYLEQRSRIMPRQPPPPTPQEQLDKNIATYTFPDGTKVPGLIGMRNGVPEFKAIENPAAQQQDKQALAQLKIDATAAATAQKLEQGNAQFQQTMQQKAIEQQMKLQQAQIDADMKRKEAVYKAWSKMRENIISFKAKANGTMDPSAKAMAADYETQAKESFAEHYGDDFSRMEPEQASKLGIQPAQQQPAQSMPAQQPGAAAPPQPAANQTPAQADLSQRLKPEQVEQVNQVVLTLAPKAEASIVTLQEQYGENGPPEGSHLRIEWNRAQRLLKEAKALGYGG